MFLLLNLNWDVNDDLAPSTTVDQISHDLLFHGNE